MTKNPLIAGLSAGGVAAVLYLSLATGSGIGLLLFYLAPLPGFIAGFGWGLRAAGIAALSGTLLILASLGVVPATAYCFSLAVPSVLITHYAFLYRLVEPQGEHPHDDQSEAYQPQEEEPRIEWYPVGNIILVVALYGGLLGILSVLLIGPSYEAYQNNVTSTIDLIMSKAGNAGILKQLTPEMVAQYKKLVMAILPAATTILWSLFALMNMWLAAHIVRLSELMSRPWPDFSSMDYPFKASLAFVVALFLSLTLPGMAGLLMSALAGSLMLAFLLLGLAVVHHVTRSWQARSLILFGTYVAVIFIGWGALILIVVGAIEPFAQIRQRLQAPDS
ncbi:MAG: YybS family protein [Hyphomicrobiaceae bacterium]|nr:YybS family protein [Hyphomicrobiaceae bacterium]